VGWKETGRKKLLKTYEVQVLGCKVNQYDAAQIDRLLERFGLVRVVEGERPDLTVVHSCAVTAGAVQKTRQMLARLRRRAPQARAFLTGCAVRAEPQLAGDTRLITVASGPDWLERMAEKLARLPMPCPDAGLLPAEAEALFPLFGCQTRAFLKVQEGCDAGCAYCIIPALRPRLHDKPVVTGVQEAEGLVAAGFRELVVTGIHLGFYGRGGGSSLAELLRALVAVPGLERIRLGSLHPAELSSELLEVWADSPKMMPHLHLSLQSGSDPVLARMRRGYRSGDFQTAVDRAQAMLDEPSFTTDVIAGFPGETEAQFEETLEFCRFIGFMRMHVFPFSARPGTVAASMPDPLPEEVVQERADRLRQLSRQLAHAWHQRQLGRTVPVLAEPRAAANGWEGYAPQYFPVRFHGPEGLRGKICRVAIARADADGVEGVLVQDS